LQLEFQAPKSVATIELGVFPDIHDYTCWTLNPSDTAASRGRDRVALIVGNRGSTQQIDVVVSFWTPIIKNHINHYYHHACLQIIIITAINRVNKYFQDRYITICKNDVRDLQ